MNKLEKQMRFQSLASLRKMERDGASKARIAQLRQSIQGKKVTSASPKESE